MIESFLDFLLCSWINYYLVAFHLIPIDHLRVVFVLLHHRSDVLPHWNHTGVPDDDNSDSKLGFQVFGSPGSEGKSRLILRGNQNSLENDCELQRVLCLQAILLYYRADILPGDHSLADNNLQLWNIAINYVPIGI